MKKYYTLKEAAKILGLTEGTLRNYVSEGTVESVKKLNTRAITKEEIERQKTLRR